MVVLNLTLVIELGLFLVFLWVTNKIILSPILRVMDDRDAKMSQDLQQAETDTAEAEKLEKKYTLVISTERRASHVAFEKARRAAMDEHSAALSAHKREADAAVAVVAEEAEARVEQERQQYDALVPGIAADIAGHLGLGDRS